MTELAIRMQGVSKDYPYFALQQVNLELPTGQVMGLIGPNGAGKSTTIRIMMGLVHQDSGDVEVLGNPMPAAQIATKWDTGFASDDMRLYEQ
jgi:ABC-2 type transport system ATP-binding protein